MDGMALTMATHDDTAPREAPADAEEVEDLLARLHGSTDPMERHRLRAEVVGRTLGLADALAHRHRAWGLDAEDLEQVARTALVAAVDRYRPGRGRGFVAFAVPTIAGELKRYFRDLAWVVRPPRPVQERRLELRAAEDELWQRRKGEVSLGELARFLDCGIDEIREARSSSRGLHPTSLDAESGSGGTVADQVPDRNDDFGALDVHTVLMDLVGRLSERDRLLLRLRFVEERSQREIGELIGVSQVHVSRLLHRVLTTLRDGLDVRAA
jgi:RNA polymerase sigma-B factor